MLLRPILVLGASLVTACHLCDGREQSGVVEVYVGADQPCPAFDKGAYGDVVSVNGEPSRLTVTGKDVAMACCYGVTTLDHEVRKAADICYSILGVDVSQLDGSAAACQPIADATVRKPETTYWQHPDGAAWIGPVAIVTFETGPVGRLENIKCIYPVTRRGSSADKCG